MKKITSIVSLFAIIALIMAGLSVDTVRAEATTQSTMNNERDEVPQLEIVNPTADEEIAINGDHIVAVYNKQLRDDDTPRFFLLSGSQCNVTLLTVIGDSSENAISVPTEAINPLGFTGDYCTKIVIYYNPQTTTSGDIVAESDIVRFTFVEEAPAETGSLRVCKIIKDIDGTLIDGANYPQVRFSGFITTGNGNNDNPSELHSQEKAARLLFTPTATTPYTLNTDVVNKDFPGAPRNDAKCVTYKDLVPGIYNYSTEAILPVAASEYFAAPLYKEFTGNQVDRNFTNFAQYNQSELSDGRIEIIANEQITVAVLNEVVKNPNSSTSSTILDPLTIPLF